MAVIVDLDHIAGDGSRLRPEIVHKPDRPLDDMAQLPRTLIRTLQDNSGALQVVTRKHIGWRHRKSPSEDRLSTNAQGGWTQRQVEPA